MFKKDGYISKTFETPIFSSSIGDLLVELGEKMEKNKVGKPCLVFTPNPEMIVLSRSNPKFKEDLLASDYNIPDGIGLVMASRILSMFGKGDLIQERITGSDMSLILVEKCRDLNLPVYLLGASENSNKRAQEYLVRKFTGLKVYGSSKPVSFDSATDSDWNEVIAGINKIKPGLLLVGYGQVRQERFLVEYKEKLEAKIAMGVGGTFDFWSGKSKRAPQIVRKFGLEWLWRVILEPSRVLRIYRATVLFGWLVLRRLFT